MKTRVVITAVISILFGTLLCLVAKTENERTKKVEVCILKQIEVGNTRPIQDLANYCTLIIKRGIHE
jgi:hypothetical protein